VRDGVDEVEVSSFVSAKWVPQLGDAAEVFAGAAGAKRPGLEFSALVPNEKGMEALLGVNATSPLVDKVCLFTAASETFNKKNTNATIAESFERFAPVLRAAWLQQLAVKIYISCAFGCPFEGEVPVGKTVDTVRMALAALAPWLYRDEGPGGFGDTEVSIADTIGVATPGDIHKVMEKAGPDGDLEGMWVESRGARPNLICTTRSVGLPLAYALAWSRACGRLTDRRRASVAARTRAHPGNGRRGISIPSYW
jgi:hydroxymethylglutaryl-CoA lyase